MESADGSGLAVSYLTDAIGFGTPTRLVARELADELIASLGRTEIRKNKLHGSQFPAISRTDSYD